MRLESFLNKLSPIFSLPLAGRVPKELLSDQQHSVLAGLPPPSVPPRKGEGGIKNFSQKTTSVRHLFLLFLLACWGGLSAEVSAASGPKDDKKKEAPAATEEHAGESAEGGAEEGGGKKGGKQKDDVVEGGRFEGDPVYVHLPQTLLPMIDEDGYQQILHMIIDIGVADLSTATKIKESFPRVQDAILTNLYAGLSDGTLRRGKSVDIDKVKQRVADSLKPLFGPDAIKDVLIQGLSQRPY